MSAPSDKYPSNRNVWPIFISYRRSDATREVAVWLKDELERDNIEATTGQIFNLDVFVDAAEAHQSDFQANLVPHLQHSRALILLADHGACMRRAATTADYLYEELDWWASRRRKTPPILLQLDSTSARKIVSDTEYARWRKVNFLDCFWDKWATNPDRGEAEKTRLLKMIRDSIRNYGQVVHLEEVRRLKRWTLMASLLAIVALIAAVFWWLQREEATKQAGIAREQGDKAISAGNIATEQKNLAERRLAEANAARNAQNVQLQKASESDFALCEPYFKRNDWRTGLAYLGRSLEENAQNLEAQSSLWLKLKMAPRLWHALPDYRLVMPVDNVQLVSFVGVNRALLKLDKSTYELLEIPSGVIVWKKTLVRWETDKTENASWFKDVVLSDDGRRLAGVSEDGSLVVVDVASGESIWETNIGETFGGLAAFDPTNRYLLIHEARSVISSVDIQNKRPPFEFDVRMENGQQIGHGGIAASFLAFSPDGQYLLLELEDDIDSGGLVLFNHQTGKRIGPLTFSEILVGEGVVVFSPDGTHLVVCPEKGGLYHWKLFPTKAPELLEKEATTPTAAVWRTGLEAPNFALSHQLIDDAQNVVVSVNESENVKDRISTSEDWRKLTEDGGRARSISRSGRLLTIRSDDGVRIVNLASKLFYHPVLIDLATENPMLSGDDRWSGFVDHERGLCLWDLQRIPEPPYRDPRESTEPELKPPQLRETGPWCQDLIILLSGLTLSGKNKTEEAGFTARMHAYDRIRKLRLDGPKSDVSDPEWTALLKWWLSCQLPVKASALQDAEATSLRPALVVSSTPAPDPPQRQALASEEFARGLALRQGAGIARDLEESARCFRRAAELGYAPAQHQLGVAYAKGWGVTQSDTEAVLWYRKAAEQGFAEAQHDLAVRCIIGKGTKKDVAEGIEWHRKAAAQGWQESIEALKQHHLEP